MDSYTEETEKSCELLKSRRPANHVLGIIKGNHSEEIEKGAVVDAKTAEPKTKQQLPWAVLVSLAALIIAITILGRRVVTTSNEGLTERMYAKERQESSKPKLQGGPGVVDAICFTENHKGLIIVKGQIFHEGDVVNGFNVRKIHPDKVEFEMNGQICVQRLE